jgi:copper chaperone CopZ
MVCAFCAYSVSKNISTLPGVAADSVDVDLKGGHVQFRSSQSVNENALIALFSDSGFSLSNLEQTRLETNKNTTPATPALTLEIDRNKVEQYNSLIEYIGNIAASTPSRLLITAPAEFEDSLLKPILMGRQQVIKVRFIPQRSAMVHLQLYTEQ